MHARWGSDAARNVWLQEGGGDKFWKFSTFSLRLKQENTANGVAGAHHLRNFSLGLWESWGNSGFGWLSGTLDCLASYAPATRAGHQLCNCVKYNRVSQSPPNVDRLPWRQSTNRTQVVNKQCPQPDIPCHWNIRILEIFRHGWLW